MAIELAQRPTVSVGDVESAAIDFSPWLDAGESLAGTPAVVEVVTSDLTIATPRVNSATLAILGEDVPPGRAVQFAVSGQKTGMRYTLRVTVSTDATPARTCVRDAIITVR